ncbi:hypothetical protein SAMN05421509_10737 [Chromohalobacter canadensis]|uniref:Uncharacterized protein n=1 Tax=Chromohalobacter canadensis TaxID=141389 RepID=A0A285VUW6_9GAMM|nr:hypothetical protein [Chromohalobacter canadensis]SOC56431.1 hypothetical protein SAMN05421509_10737 [Chromohalobacter canadensis]
MSASVHQLPTRHAQGTPLVESDGRAGWGALRAELHDRCEDRDLAALWDEMETAERRAVLASARGDADDARRAIESMPSATRRAIRSAIHRMSGYGKRLRDRLEGDRPHPSRELASHARAALAEGNTNAALHWLALIERGVE